MTDVFYIFLRGRDWGIDRMEEAKIEAKIEPKRDTDWVLQWVLVLVRIAMFCCVSQLSTYYLLFKNVHMLDAAKS